jgi:ankyrin repeat protein
MSRLFPSLLFACIALSIFAQTLPTPPPVNLPPSQQVTLIGPRDAIHAEDDPLPTNLAPIQRAIQQHERISNNLVSVDLDVVVNESGRVESAHAVSGPERFYAQAEAIEFSRVFEPIRVDGQVVRAHFHDDVSIYPPEHWSPTHVDFPEQFDIASVTIRLERTHCFGTCPAYTVTVSGTGVITFVSNDTSLAVPGHHTANISPDIVRTLISQFEAADFLSAQHDYRCGLTDMPTQTLTLSVAGLNKQVVDYGGKIVGMPSAIADLEQAIDKATDTARWVKGNNDTTHSLIAEHWDFSSLSSDNLAIYGSAITHDNTDLVHVFLAAHAPISTDDPKRRSPICIATQKGSRDLVRQMLDTAPRDAKPSPALLAECLSAASRSGDLPVLELWLDKGARPNPQAPPRIFTTDVPHDYLKFRSPLLGAIDSGNPEVLARLLSFHPNLNANANDDTALILYAVQRGSGHEQGKLPEILNLLIAADADINATGNQISSPIFNVALVPEAIPILIHAGVNPNSRDSQGNTPLMRSCFVIDAVKAFLAAGADPTLKNRYDQTAFDLAKSYSCPECVALLQKAIAGLPASITP